MQTELTPALQSPATVYTDSDLQRITVGVVMMTPSMARALRSSAHFERQRPISAVNIARLSYEMKQGWFIVGTPIYIGVLPDTSMLILNGNHTLEAVVSSGESIPLTVIYTQVPDIETAANIYANMDLQKMRTWHNSLQATQGHATFFDNKVLNALGLINDRFTYRKTQNTRYSTSRTARFAMFEEYRNAASVIQQARVDVPESTKRMLNRIGVMAVALVTAKYQPSAAFEFWQAVAQDDGLSVGDPRKALLRYLANNPARASDDRYAHGKAAALCWNAAYENRELQAAHPGKLHTMTILGTAWHKGPPSATPVPTPRDGKLETGIVTSGNGTQATVARYNRAQPKAARP